MHTIGLDSGLTDRLDRCPGWCQTREYKEALLVGVVVVRNPQCVG